jgi:hypothetical protein
MCRRLFQQFCDGVQGERTRTVDAVQFLREAWDQLETKVIQVRWGIYELQLGFRRNQMTKAMANG